MYCMPLPDAPPPGLQGQVDTLYLDPAEALSQAKLGARVPLPGTTTGLQVCWYLGDKDLPGAPVNCVRLPISGMENPVAHFLAQTELRWPEAIRFAAHVTQGEVRDKYRKMVDWALHNAVTIHAHIMEKDQERLNAGFQLRQPGEPLRVMGLASRVTTVTQYVMQALLAGFGNLGHEHRIIIEPDDMSKLSRGKITREIADFKPHVMICINHVDFPHTAIPADMVKVIWWQDLMPELTAGTKIPWRERDLVYLIMAGLGFKHALLNTGLAPERMKFQSLIVDEAIFNRMGPEKRERKIVFVGVNAIPQTDAQIQAARILEKRLEHGERITLDHVDIGLSAKDDTFIRMAVMHGAVRRHVVKMLCRHSKIPVEIWGRGWEAEPELWPYLKGEINHGAHLASLYRSASHGLSVHPEIINHSRLGEIAGCGCVPVVYDIRHIAEPPFWEDHIRYFHDPESLCRALCGDDELPDCQPIMKHLGNTSFAAKIISDAGSWLDPVG